MPLLILCNLIFCLGSEAASSISPFVPPSKPEGSSDLDDFCVLLRFKSLFAEYFPIPRARSRRCRSARSFCLRSMRLMMLWSALKRVACPYRRRVRTPYCAVWYHGLRKMRNTEKPSRALIKLYISNFIKHKQKI